MTKASASASAASAASAVLSTAIQAVKEAAPTPALPVAAPVAAAAPVAPEGQPSVIVITDRIGLAFDMAASLIRTGYILSPNNPPEVFPSMGQAVITLVTGDPSAAAIEAAEASVARAIGIQQAAYARDVDNAARLTAEDLARKVKQATLAAEVAEAKKALRRLQDTLAAA